MFILGPLRDALLNALYINGVPNQPRDLYQFLISKRKLLAQLKGRGVITKPQWEILYPHGKTETDSNLFDITLILVLIEALTTIKPSDGNWRQDNPPVIDISVGAFCIRARKMRNYLNHFPRITALKYPEFSITWDELLVIINGLGHNTPFDVNYLRTVNLNLQDNLLLRAIILYNQTKLNHHDTQIHELTNKNLSLENQTNLNTINMNKMLERMQCKLWSNSTDIEDIQEELEQAHNSITQMQEDIACLKDDVKGVKVRVEKLESWPNFLTALQNLCQQYYPISVISIAIIVIAVSICYFSSGDDKNLKEASDLLRQYYLEGIGKEHIESINGQTMSRKRFYVDLAIVDSLDVDINNTHSAREFHIKQMLSQKGKCTMENLLEEENQIVLLRGIGGIGKSFMVNTMALNWAEKRIWRNFQFVFLFKFREMNLVRNISSLHDLILKKYPFLFTKMKFTDLVPVSKKIIFIMDGFDEFTRVEDLHIISNQQSENVSDISRVIFEAINPYNVLLPGHKTIITSRPNACPTFRKSFFTASIKQVDILGFSSDKVLDYIKVFSGSDTKLGNILRKKIDESKQLQLLSRIPVYLWTICSLYQEQRFFDAPKTTTELFVWQLALFLHRHYKNRPSNHLTPNVFAIFKEKYVRKVVFSLSFLARKMLVDGVILIDVDDIPEEICNENIEATGLVSKHQTMDGLKYQFNHLLMQEFLTAMYYFFPEGKHVNDITSNPSLSGCLPLVCGLYGALKVKSESSSILKQFVKNMGLVRYEINPLENMLRTENLQLLQGMFEYQNKLSDEIIHQCKLNSDYIDFLYTVDALQTQFDLSLIISQILKAFFLVLRALSELIDIPSTENKLSDKIIQQCILKVDYSNLFLTVDASHTQFDFMSIFKQIEKTASLVLQAINQFKNIPSTENLQLLQRIFEYQNNLSDKIILQCILEADNSDLLLTVDASHTQTNSVSVLKQLVKTMRLFLQAINQLINIPSTESLQLLEGLFEYQSILIENILKSGCKTLYLTVDASHTQSELVHFLEKWRNDFNVFGIIFEPNQGGVSCAVGLSKIMSDICSLNTLKIYSNSFDQDSLKYLITSLHNCSKRWLNTSKWNSIFFIYREDDFNRDYGEVTRALFDTLLRYKKVHLHVRCHSRRVIYDLSKSIMQNKYEMRLEKLHLDIRAIKPYFCQMLAEILLRVKEVEVWKAGHAVYRFSDDEADCLKEAIDNLLKKAQTKSKLMNTTNYVVLQALVIQNWELRVMETSWNWEYRLDEKTSSLPFETNVFEAYCITVVLAIQILPLFLIPVLFEMFHLTSYTKKQRVVYVTLYIFFLLCYCGYVFVIYKVTDDFKHIGPSMSM